MALSYPNRPKSTANAGRTMGTSLHKAETVLPRTARHAVVLALLALGAAVAGAYVSPHDPAEPPRPTSVEAGATARPAAFPSAERQER